MKKISINYKHKIKNVYMSMIIRNRNRNNKKW